MPMVYGVAPGANQTTSGTTNTEVDSIFVKPGSGRTVALIGAYFVGKANAATTLSGISHRCKHFPTTASAVNTGTSITPKPRDIGSQAAKATAASGVGGALTSGTGTAVLHWSVGHGGSTGASWVAQNNEAPVVLEAGANMSIDIFDVAVAVSLAYEQSLDIQE